MIKEKKKASINLELNEINNFNLHFNNPMKLENNFDLNNEEIKLIEQKIKDNLFEIKNHLKLCSNKMHFNIYRKEKKIHSN